MSRRIVLVALAACSDASGTAPDAARPIDARVDAPGGPLAASRTTVMFGSVPVGTQSPGEPIVLTSDDATPMLSFVLAGSNPNDFTILANSCDHVALPAHSSCALVVRMTPQSVGSKEGRIEISGGPQGTFPIALVGTSVTNSTLLTVAPTSADFGAVRLGQTSVLSTFTLSNGGGTTIGPFTVDPPAGGQFAIEANACAGGFVAPGASCSFGVRFVPTVAGATTKSITIAPTNAAAVNVGLSGAGSDLAMTPAMKDFGNVTVGQFSPSQTFTVTTSTATGVLTTAFIGPDSSQFQVVGTTCDVALPAGGSCTVVVRFHPTVNATFTSRLDVSESGGVTLSSPLQGTGTP